MLLGLLLAGLAYACLPLIIANLLETRLLGLGFDSAEISLAQPTGRQLRLDGLKLAISSGDWTYSLNADGMTVDYQPLELLAGHVEGIRVAKVEIERMPLAGKPKEGGPGSLKPDLWLAGLPMESLAVDTLIVSLGHGPSLLASIHIRNGEALAEGKLLSGQGASFSARATDKGALEINILDAQSRALLRLDNRLADAGGGMVGVTGSLKANLGPMATQLAPFIGWLGPPKGMEGTLQSHWRGEIPSDPADSVRLKLESEHHLSLEMPRFGVNLQNLKVRADLSARFKGKLLEWRIAENFQLSALTPARPNDGKEDARLKLELPKGQQGQIRWEPDRADFKISPGFPFRLSPLRWNGYSLDETHLELADEARFSLDFAANQWSLAPLSLSLEKLALRMPEAEAKAGPLRLKLDKLEGANGDWQGVGVLKMDNLQASLNGKPLPAATLEAPFHMDRQKLQGDGRLSLGPGADPLILRGRFEHEFSLGSGRASFELAPAQFDENHKLAERLSPWNAPLELGAGRIAATGEVVWLRGGPVQGAISLTLENLAGQYENLAFAGLNASLDLHNNGGFFTIKPANLAIDKLDIGFPITAVRLMAGLEAADGLEQATLHEFSAALLGGRVKSQASRFDLADESFPLILELDSLSLGQIVALEGRKDLETTGILSGRLPVEISRAGFAIHGGELEARPPGGIIRYRPAQDAQSVAGANPGMKLLFGALSDLRYQTLKVHADSAINGDLTLKVALKGHNPNWQSGRPIQFNLGLQENIPALLKSLSVAGDVGKKLRQHYQNNP